jgi:hypothetical protein
MRRLSPAVAALPLALAAGGCVHTENDNIALAGRVGLPGLVGQPAAAPAWPEGPSLTGIDRSNWGRTSIEVPVNGIGHGPLYSHTLYRAHVTRRQRGEYPTPESSLDLVEGSTARQRGEAIAAPFTSIGQIILMTPRMFFQPPWSDDYSPKERYERYWHPQGPDPAAPEGEG